jgi:hypothetical protein
MRIYKKAFLKAIDEYKNFKMSGLDGYRSGSYFSTGRKTRED